MYDIFKSGQNIALTRARKYLPAKWAQCVDFGSTRLELEIRKTWRILPLDLFELNTKETFVTKSISRLMARGGGGGAK